MSHGAIPNYEWMEYLRVLLIQGCVIGVAIMVASLYGWEVLYSALLGCLIAWLPNQVFKKVFLPQANFGKNQSYANTIATSIVKRFYVAEALKFATFIPLVIIALKTPFLRPSWFMLYLVGTWALVWSSRLFLGLRK